MRLTHQLEKDVGYKVLQFINTIKITKLLMCLIHNMLMKNFCIKVHQL